MMLMPACDYSLFPKVNTFTFGMGRGPYGAHLKCFLKKPVLAYHADYVKQFFDTYKNERKFFSMRIIESHEFTGEQGNMIIDPILNKMLRHLEKQGHLENTVVHIFSDHGDHINPIGYKSFSGKVERYNPFYMMMVPEHIVRSSGDTLKANTQRLTIADDIFETNLEMLGFERQHKIGISLMKQVIPVNRTCQSAGLYDPNNQCYCLPK